MNAYVPFTSHDASRQWLTHLAQSAVSAVYPDRLFGDCLPNSPDGRTVVVGAGKAAAAMAKALESAWEAHCPTAPLEGMVVTRYGHSEPCRHIEVLEASHPMPDDLGIEAAQRILDRVGPLTADDLVIVLVSGGGSALLTLPAPGLELADKQAVNQALLRCGAPIQDINTVRRHLSAIKGGRLAFHAHPARVVTYLVSDVPGDEPSLVASGPTLPDDSTAADALALIEHYGIEIPDSVYHHLTKHDNAPRRDDPGFARDEALILARARDALEAARERAERSGVDVRILGDDLEGEARELGQAQGRLALECQSEIDRPLLILSGGETSVTVHGDGRGGRNVEYLLGLFAYLKGAAGIYALAIDTDGIDGSEDNAGAMFGPTCWDRARAARISPVDYLDNNDAYHFFAELDGLIVTGPTRTNVNDFRAILVLPKA
ncbi:glycerate kinase type-2 family protein [Aidingimonas halophila]|uniref:Glycerate 2-kinase n=1 Tax=Aidingimonas halophila TaxID=574349 RepID=A0A1H2XXB2_9GAMM|nr:glycerate kinase [Aidingimonas halophila]GHC29380.1 hydroxypyruvate reductase [Aidingimonas halophila]SDW97451.1 glycerate 2-kinase [Aidingimonas halophila]